MPNQIEPNVNNTLGDLLRGMMPGSKVLSENTQTFPAHPGQHADVLITAPGRSPVVVEAEYEPAPEAEKLLRQAQRPCSPTPPGTQRLRRRPRTIEAAIALRSTPRRLRMPTTSLRQSPLPTSPTASASTKATSASPNLAGS